jgi:hypothetical protein
VDVIYASGTPQRLLDRRGVRALLFGGAVVTSVKALGELGGFRVVWRFCGAIQGAGRDAALEGHGYAVREAVDALGPIVLVNSFAAGAVRAVPPPAGERARPRWCA